MRRLVMLNNGLPARVGGWTQAHELAAQQMEIPDFWLRAIYARVYQASSPDGKPPDLPPPFRFDHPDRPGDRKPDEVEGEPGEVKDSVKLRGLFGGPANPQEGR